MTKKIFQSIAAVSLTVLVAALALVMGVLYSYFDTLEKTRLSDELALAAEGVELDGKAYLEHFDGARDRLTWIEPDGTVLYDTEQAGLENHQQREEVREAEETGTGTSVRYSETLMERRIYQAQKLADGTILRISASHLAIWSLFMGLFYPVLLIVLGMGILAWFLARGISRRIVEPLDRLDLDHPLQNETYPELLPVLERMHRQKGQIKSQLAQLKQKTEEFEQVTGHMQEGLVLLDGKGQVLSMNAAAQALYDPAAETGGSRQLKKDGRIWLEECSDVAGGGKVLLYLDITDRAQAEANRRMFTANVSHELKTPLQSILGTAELMESGLVKPEDIPVMTRRVRQETERLCDLVQDIFRLSRLDEGVHLEREPVNLLDLAEETKNRLDQKANLHHVSVQITGHPVTVLAPLVLLQDVMYNLTDNAIKYNKEGGSVSIELLEDGFAISDTGPGIPRGERGRVFERFYRIRNTNVEGTGLGLSIVKHALEQMGGSISIDDGYQDGCRMVVYVPVFKTNNQV